MDTTRHVCLEKLLREDRVTCHFQPIVAARQRKVIGYEALCRAHDASGTLLFPDALFAAAGREGLLLELDRRCRERAARLFAGLWRADPELLLFFNLDVSVIREGIVGSGHLRASFEDAGIPPGNVVIEIIESAIGERAAFFRFLDSYRASGFLIALDDIGSGYSNLDRISLIKPDIIKLDRSLLTGLDREYHRQAVVLSLVNLARRIGSLVVAEGVEREEEVLSSMELGADFLQGYFLARPQPVDQAAMACGRGCLDRLADRFRGHFLSRMELKSRVYRGFRGILERKVAELAGCGPAERVACMERVFTGSKRVECLYLLDSFGIQVTPTVLPARKTGAIRGGVFQPAEAGADQSLKEYFLVLQGEGAQSTSEPYISLATGSICVTFSSRFTTAAGESLVICMDVNVEGIFPGINPRD